MFRALYYYSPPGLVVNLDLYFPFPRMHTYYIGSPFPIVHANWSLVFRTFAAFSERLKTALILLYNNNNSSCSSNNSGALWIHNNAPEKQGSI